MYSILDFLNLDRLPCHRACAAAPLVIMNGRRWLLYGCAGRAGFGDGWRLVDWRKGFLVHPVSPGYLSDSAGSNPGPRPFRVCQSVYALRKVSGNAERKSPCMSSGNFLNILTAWGDLRKAYRGFIPQILGAQERASRTVAALFVCGLLSSPVEPRAPAGPTPLCKTCCAGGAYRRPGERSNSAGLYRQAIYPFSLLHLVQYSVTTRSAGTGTRDLS